jgi:hypothetical protein
MKRNSALAGLALAAALAVSDCSLAPKLTLQDVPTAPTYKEQAPWTPAQPADGLSRGDCQSRHNRAARQCAAQRRAGRGLDVGTDAGHLNIGRRTA